MQSTSFASIFLETYNVIDFMCVRAHSSVHRHQSLLQNTTVAPILHFIPNGEHTPFI